MNLFMNQILDAQTTEPKVEEEKTNEPKETHDTAMVLWECETTLGIDEEDRTKEI